MIKVENAPRGDGFASVESLVANITAGRRVLAGVDEGMPVEQSTAVDGIANVLLAVLADCSRERTWALEDDDVIDWTMVEDMIAEVCVSAREHALADFANLLDADTLEVAAPRLPMPGDSMGSSRTVIASTWTKDGGDEHPYFMSTVMCLNEAPPYYTVMCLRSSGDTWTVDHATDHPNINPATEDYADLGGDY